MQQNNSLADGYMKRFFIENVPEFLDGPSEFFHDVEGGALSRRRDCHSAELSLSITIETPTKGREGGAAE